MKDFLRLYTVSFIKSKFGPIFLFAFPLLMFLIIAGIMPFRQITGGMLMLPGMTLGLLVCGMLLSDFKRSSIFKRTALTSVTKWELFGAIIIFNMILTAISTVWVLILIVIFNAAGIGMFDLKIDNITIIKDVFKIYWTDFTFTEVIIMFVNIVLAGLMFVSIGMFIGTKMKVPTNSTLVGLIIYLPLSFISGVMVDYSFIANNATLNKLSMYTPTRWVFEPVIRIWEGQGMDAIRYAWSYPVGIVFAIAMTALFMTLTVRTFNYE